MRLVMVSRRLAEAELRLAHQLDMPGVKPSNAKAGPHR